MAEDHLEQEQRTIATALSTLGTVRRYPARSFVFHEADAAGAVMVLESGLVRIDRGTSTGKVVLINLIATGEPFGELSAIDDSPRSASASTVTESVVRRVPTRDFNELLAHDRELHVALLRSVTKRLRALTTQFVESASMDAQARIAARLIRLIEIDRSLGHSVIASDQSVDLRLPISQAELGQWCGLSREGTVKGLSTLRALGVLTTGRKKVHITDLARLRAIAAT